MIKFTKITPTEGDERKSLHSVHVDGEEIGKVYGASHGLDGFMASLMFGPAATQYVCFVGFGATMKEAVADALPYARKKEEAIRRSADWLENKLSIGAL